MDKEQLKDMFANPREIRQILEDAKRAARNRSLSNLITEFGSSTENFFNIPDMYKRFHPPNPDGRKHIGIPKWMANRYAKIWLVMFPVRVNCFHYITQYRNYHAGTGYG